MNTRSPLRTLLAVAILLLSGCDYFRPARPEIPTDAPPVVPTDYSSPDALLQTLKLAIEDKSQTTGETAYIEAFVDSRSDGQTYTATFDPLTVARFNPAPNTNWDRDREDQFYSTKLSVLDAGYKFLFIWGDFEGAPSDILDDPSTATLYRSYRLRATIDDGASYVDEARGNVELHLALIGTKWKIVKWMDYEDPRADFDHGQRSFGFLRLGGS